MNGRLMMNAKRTWLLVSILIIVGLSCSTISYGYPTFYPTGTTKYDPEKASSGYILIPEGYVGMNDPGYKSPEQMQDPSKRDLAWAVKGEKSQEVRLIDMNGNVVHAWKVVPNFDARARLLSNGHLLLVDEEINAEIVEYDWDNNIVWRYKAKGTPHHDVHRLANGNTLVLVDEHVPEAFLKDIKDADVPWWHIIKRKGIKLVGDAIYEVTPKGAVVWEWHTHDYLDLKYFSPVVPNADWTHANTITPLPENKWYDAGDKRFKPGNILFSPRNFDKVYIIDKETKKIVWEWTHTYKGGMSHQHEPIMIPKGMPGEGNIILFDNGLFPRHRDHNGVSIVFEFNPVTKDTVWKYETYGYSNQKFFSKTKGSISRLPNGNTFISEDNNGRIFQVTPAGDIVWEYVNRSDVSRAIAYPYDYTPQLKAMPKPKELKVTPPNNLEWHLIPDALR
jgi:Arylsulfotransferase (ASST)